MLKKGLVSTLRTNPMLRRHSIGSSGAGVSPIRQQRLPIIRPARPGVSRAPLLPKVMRKKLSYPDFERPFHKESRLFNPPAILIEDKASGTQLIQQLIEAGFAKVTRYSPDDDKKSCGCMPDRDDRGRVSSIYPARRIGFPNICMN